MLEQSHRTHKCRKLRRRSPAGEESRFISNIQACLSAGNANRMFVTERAEFGNSARRGGIFQCSLWNTWGCGSKGFRKTHTKEVVGGCGWVPTAAYARSSGDRQKALGSTLTFSYCKYLTGPPCMRATREANCTALCEEETEFNSLVTENFFVLFLWRS